MKKLICKLLGHIEYDTEYFIDLMVPRCYWEKESNCLRCGAKL